MLSSDSFLTNFQTNMNGFAEIFTIFMFIKINVKWASIIYLLLINIGLWLFLQHNYTKNVENDTYHA
jgi:hypothetical protein